MQAQAAAFSLMKKLVILALCFSGAGAAFFTPSQTQANQLPEAKPKAPISADAAIQTATPIKHVVILFQENVSFDHYFGTYPNALNPPGETRRFVPKPETPTVNGLTEFLLTHNPNGANPQRLDRSLQATTDQDHDYREEQRAFNGGLMDKFVSSTGKGGTVNGHAFDASVVMDYFDGNTVTALWNYAQNFAMSDNFFGSTFGPSTPGALNIASGQTHGIALSDPAAIEDALKRGDLTPDGNGNFTVINDPDPVGDLASRRTQIAMTGKNIGDLLNAKQVSWGWFQGGFETVTPENKMGSVSMGAGGKPAPDYIPHHEPFQYYASTANPNHVRPKDLAEIGHNGQANHQYGLVDFFAALDADCLPAVSYLKAPGFQDGHAGYSDPQNEQEYLVATINRLEKSPAWKSMAIIVCYDDSDGWYDHVMGPIVQQSNTVNDALLAGADGKGNAGAAKPGEYGGRAGYGPRLPMLVISPFARVNFVDHQVTDQTSTLRFIEDNWSLGRIGDQSFDARANSLVQMFDFKRSTPAEPLFLDETTGLAEKPFQGY